MSEERPAASPVPRNQRRSPTQTISTPRFSKWRPGSISGPDWIRAESLRNATIDPVKVMAPMKTPRKTSRPVDGVVRPPWTRSSSSQVVSEPNEHGREADEAVQHAR